MPSVIALLLPLLFTIAPLRSAIIKVEQLASIKEILGDADDKDMIVFDVDQTLILPEDMLLRPCGEDFFKASLAKIQATMPEERLQQLGSKLLLQRTIRLIDEDLPLFISELQNRSCKVIALTAMITGRLGHIPSMEDWRFGELKSFGIDFSGAFPYYNHIVFGDIKKEGSLPIFKNGILCSARNTKGEVLESFLQRIKWQPKRVFFIDDHLHFLESVQAHMNQAGIEFIGIHYRAMGTLEDVFEKELAILQLEHLIQNEEWINDAQLKLHLEEKADS